MKKPRKKPRKFLGLLGFENLGVYQGYYHGLWKQGVLGNRKPRNRPSTKEYTMVFRSYPEGGRFLGILRRRMLLANDTCELGLDGMKNVATGANLLRQVER